MLTSSEQDDNTGHRTVRPVVTLDGVFYGQCLLTTTDSRLSKQVSYKRSKEKKLNPRVCFKMLTLFRIFLNLVLSALDNIHQTIQ